jgi:uncharacterized membrane protein YgdD (TMEM256/DUF423 family)
MRPFVANGRQLEQNSGARLARRHTHEETLSYVLRGFRHPGHLTDLLSTLRRLMNRAHERTRLRHIAAGVLFEKARPSEVMNRWAVTACVLGCLGVIGGALGAHALRKVLTPERIAAFETAIQYLMFHAIVLLAVSLYGSATGKQLVWPPRLFVTGIALFSGSIVLLTTTPLRGFGWVTPLGGLCLIAGWVALAFELGKS